METKTGVKKSSSGIGRDAAEFLADAEGERPFLFPHEMMETKLKDFGAVLMAFVDRIKFGERIACDPELCVAAGSLQLPFALHGSLSSTSRAIVTAALLDSAAIGETVLTRSDA